MGCEQNITKYHWGGGDQNITQYFWVDSIILVELFSYCDESANKIEPKILL